MRLDRKLLLIAPAIVLVLVAVGMAFAAFQLRVLSSVSDTWKERSDFIAAVERGEKKLDQRQSIGLLRVALEVEERRTAAIVASRDLLITLSFVELVACAVLVFGIRSVPREHWPRLNMGRSGA
jgi:predicted RND superfamily exporter protein